ncbi:GEVED domain-containing protein [Emticicia agri]|uniref:T9SS type A sorting domain-containing protein n=1 Tax=Emticicia agri TaxID=2492393 RepID=A0A4Q5LUY9_9BACT|nr:GEVED domain-containing protein [Emticicia agri]RYU93355.1 T9SS type A sorting domain-containing protein [Emticicia agri]
MKKLFYLLVLLLPVFNSLAQDPWCTTKAPTQSQKGIFLQQFQLQETMRARKGEETVTNVALKIHLLSKSDGSMELFDNDIKELMDSLNMHFIDAKIQFYLCGGIDYINDGTFYKFDTRSESAFCKVHDVDNAINLYLVKEFTDPGLGGYAYFPNSDKKTNRIFCAYKNRTDLITKILPHEMGHYFGLLHTFQDAGWEGYSEVVSRGEKANCAYRGDLLCDTPADPYGSVISDIKNCEFSSNYVDVNGDRYSPQIGNLMSYYRGCGNFFTPGQIGMIKTGLLVRLIQDNNRANAYSIDCEGVNSNQIVTKDIYLDGVRKTQEGWVRICVEKPFVITFNATGNFKSDNEFKATLISSRRNFSAEIGSGKGNEITCKIPKDFPVDLAYCYIQVTSTSPAISSSFSSFAIYGNKIPTAEISGNYNIFENEEIAVPIKLSGGIVQMRLNNNDFREFGVDPNPKLYFRQQKSTTISFTRVWNECGDGVGKGQIELNVIPKPVARNFSIGNISGTYLCEGKPMMLSIKADGIFNQFNTFKLFLSDKDGNNFKEIAHNTTTGGVLELKVPEGMPVGDNYRIKVVSSNPAIESISQDLSVQAKAIAVLSGDTTIYNGQKAQLQIHLLGKKPFTLVTSQGDSLISAENFFQWQVSPTEDKVFSLKSVSNEACGNGTVQGNAAVKVNYGLRTSTLNFPFVCAGSEIKIPYEVQDGVVMENEYMIQLSDKTGKNFTTIGNSSKNPLTAVIPADIPEGSNYRVRVVSKSGAYIGSESNEFEIRQKPSAFLEGSLVGNKGTKANLTVKLTGGGPWNVALKSEEGISTISTTQNPTLIPVTLGNSTTYTLETISNACGTGQSYGQAVSNVREKVENYCVPFVSANQQLPYGRITRVRLTDMDGRMLLNSFDIKMGVRNYTDNTAMVANLKPGGSYNYDIISSDGGSETNFWSDNYYYIVAWIDYDQNGRFDRNETFVENALEYSWAKFTVPENAKRGLTRMRVRTYREDPESVLNNACASIYGGETEDYTINITDDAPNYSAEIKFDERALCKVKEYEFPFEVTGTFAHDNTFRVALYNGFGNFLGYIGEGKTSPIKIKFPTDIPVGANYKLKLVASAPYYEGIFTKAFRINDTPTATLSGNQRAYFGQAMPLNILLEGGADWSYSVGNGVNNGGGGMFNASQNKLIIDYPGEASYLTPTPGIYDFKMNRVINTACGDGKVQGSARLEVLEPDPSAVYISKIKTQFSGWMFTQAIYRCKDYNYSSRISFETKGIFDKDNYFTCHLISPDDKFVAVVGYAKTNELYLDIPPNIDGYGYKVKVISSAPYSESPLSMPFAIMAKPAANISGYSEILPGEQATIQLSLTGREPWDITLSDGTSIVTGIPVQSLKVSPASTQVYTINRLYAYPCIGETSGSATVKVLKPRATGLRVQQPNEICIGGNMVLGFQSNGTFRERNHFKVVLSDNSGARFKDMETKLINDSTLYFSIPTTVPPGDDYKIKLISTSPYLESDITNTFRLRPVSTATISSEVKSVYEKATIRLRVDFTGDAPYTIELSDGRHYENITQNPYFIDLKATVGIDKYTIKRVSNSCGQGKTSGIVTLNIMPLPVITTQPLSINSVCAGNRIFVPYIISNGEFQADNVFKVDLFDVSNNSWRVLETTMKNDSLFAVIPLNLSGGTYTVRVNGTSPSIIGSLSDSRFTVRTYPVGNISGKTSVMEGDSASFLLTLSGDSPWTIRLSNGTELKDVTSSNFPISFIPQKSETLTITSVRNICGEGSFTGQAAFVVHKLEDIENLVKIYPIPFQQETRLYIDEALLKQAAYYTVTDILGRVILTRTFESTQTPIDLSFYPAGIYYTRISTSKKQFFRKIVK